VATPSTLLVQLITRRQHTDKIPLVCPSRCMLPLCHRAVTYHYGPALVPVVRGYKRRPCPLPFVHAQVLVSAPVSCHHFPYSSPAAATLGSAAHRLSISLHRSRSFIELWSCSSSHWTPTFPAGAPPHYRCSSELSL
jgi:hypothetical protein